MTSVSIDQFPDSGHEFQSKANLSLYADNIRAFSERHENTGLFEYQSSVMEDLKDFIETSAGATEQDIEAYSGHIVLPTGTGKTAVAAALVGALKPNPDESKKTLFLVPRVSLVAQTIGNHEDEDKLSGFARFAPGHKVTPFMASDKDETGDVVVMTYQSLLVQAQNPDWDTDKYDLVIADEAHRSLGTKTRLAMEKVATGALTIGLTATPRYNERHIDEIFTQPISTMYLREAIESGYVSPVRGVLIGTESELPKAPAYNNDYTVEQLEKLMYDEWRNQATVKIARQHVERGEQGLVSCIPGGSAHHAHLLAERLASETILDSKTGEQRAIKAVALDSTMPKSEIQKYMDAAREGDIDVIAFVDLLNEGVDLPCFSFLVNTRPTLSPVLAEQRIGRVGRLTTDKIATIYDFIDKSTNRPVTFFDVIDEPEIRQGRIFGSSDRSNGAPEPIEDLPLPDDLLTSIRSIEGKTIKELLVEQGRPQDMEDGEVSLFDLSRASGISVITIRARLMQYDIETTHRLSVTGRTVETLTAEAYERLLASEPLFNLPRTSDDEFTLRQAREFFGLADYKTLKNAIADTGLALSLRRGRNGQAIEVLTEEDMLKLAEHPVVTTPYRESGELTRAEIGRALGLGSAALKSVIDGLGLATKTRKRQGGQLVQVFSTPDVEVIKHNVGNIPDQPEDSQALSQLAKSTERSVYHLKAIIDDLGLEGHTVKLAGTRNIVSVFTKEEIEQIKSHPKFMLERVQKAAQSSDSDNAELTILDITREIGVSSKAVVKYIGELGITGELKIIHSGHEREVYPRSVIEALKVAYPHINIPRADETDVSIRSLRTLTGFHDERLMAAAEKLGIRVYKRRFINGKPANAIPVADQDRLLAAIRQQA